MDPSLGLVSIEGDLDREHAGRLAGMVAVLAGTSHEVWVIDLGGVLFCDVSGLRALAAAATAADAHGRRLLITRSSRWMQRLIVLAGQGHLVLPTAPASFPHAAPAPDPRSGPARAHRQDSGCASGVAR